MGHDGYWYQRENMPATAGGRDIEQIVGEPSRILSRGENIVEQGEMMRSAARTLEMFADGTIGSGESFEAVREQAKEVYADLRTAGERYLPSGRALVRYAGALETVQSETDGLVTRAASAWERVNDTSRALSAAEGDQQQWDFNDDHEVEQSGSRPSSAAEQSSFDSALQTFETYRAQYDAPVARWEAVYDSTLSSLQGANEDGVSDGFWDDAMPFVEGLLTVLMWVGVALIIVAFVVTGPLAAIAAALAVIVGVISLLGELARLSTGRGSWQEVALSAVAILPFGKLAGLGRLGSFASAGARFPRLSGTVRLFGSEFVDARNAFRALDSVLANRMPQLFVRGTPHGLNTRNMFRLFYSPVMVKETFALTGSWGNGWRALAGFAPGRMPQTLTEALGGAAQVYATVMPTVVSVAKSFD